MSNKDRVYGYKQAMALVDYGEDLVWEAVQANLGARSDDDRFRLSQRMLRRTARLMMWPELIIEEGAKSWPSDSSPMDARTRELFYKVLGDYSRRVMSLSDVELLKEVRALVRDYR
jgi:hypothetical protein